RAVRHWGRIRLGSAVAFALARETRDLRKATGTAKIDSDKGGCGGRRAGRFDGEAGNQGYWDKRDRNKTYRVQRHNCLLKDLGAIVAARFVPPSDNCYREGIRLRARSDARIACT